MSERLEEHRVRWALSGLPIHGQGIDVDGWSRDEIKGYVAEDEWKWDDLSSDERTKLTDDAKLLVVSSGERTPDSPISYEFAFSYTLSHFGIACPHSWRDLDKRADGYPAAFRECIWCRTSQPYPGKVHKVGDRWLRLTDPPPRYVRVVRDPEPPITWVNDPNPSPFGIAPPVDEYRWDGRVYVLA